MMPRFFDTHCHLAGEELFEECAQLSKLAWEGGVGALCLISAEEFSLDRVQSAQAKIAELCPDLKAYYSSGIHPHEAKHLNEALRVKVEEVLKTGAVGVGETGLDFHYNFSEKSDQREAFAWHVDLAVRHKKPLIIHSRDAKADVIEVLKSEGISAHDNPGILHCFTEDKAFARKLLDLGLYISFSGILTFKSATEIREVAAYVPKDRLLIETDSPYLAPVPYRGKSNQPAYVAEVFRQLSELRGEEVEALKTQIWENSERVFAL